MSMIPKITKWKNNGKVKLVDYDNKQFIIHFDEKLNNPALACYNTFIINKTSYANKLDSISRYIAYFMKYYDEDDELLMAYLKLKHDVDVVHKYTADNMDEFINDLYEIMFTPSIEHNLDQLVEYNNVIDIESDDDGKKQYKTTKKYVESLEFTNKHVSLLYKISFCMKMIIPIMMHYFVVNRIKPNSDESGNIYKFFEPLMGSRFSSEINIYNKLYVYVKCKIQENRSQNSTIYEQRDIFGKDISTLTQEFLRKKLITENLFKYEFNGNPVALNKTIVQSQLGYFIKEKYTKTMTLVNMEQNGDGLSGMEKLEMSMAKLDEGMLIFAEINIANAIESIRNRYQFDIGEDELQYMIQYHIPCELQIELITLFFTKYFGESRNIKLCNKRQYCTLALILKKLLLTMEANETGQLDISYLPYVLTGNLDGKVEESIIRNNKFVNKLQASPKYQQLINTKYKALEEIRPDTILLLISSLCKTHFTYVTPEYKEKTGEPIDTNKNKLAYEMINLLSLA